MMEMPKPTEGHKQIARFAGTWTGSEKMHPSPWDPNGGTSVARLDNRVALSGFAVIGDYQQQRDGVITFEGHSVWNFDPARGLCILYWFDSMGQAPNIFQGNFVGDTLTTSCADHQGHSRLTYVFTGPNSLQSKMEMSQDGTNWMTLFEGTYTRQG